MDYINEFFQYCKALIISRTIYLDTIRYQVNKNLYLRYLNCDCDEQSKYVILILKGGCNNFEDEIPHYVKIFKYHLNNVKMYLIENINPIIGINESKNITDSIKYLRVKEQNKKIYLIGFSMGGILIYQYLSHGHDDADLYLTVSSPINMEYFLDMINNSILYKILQRRTYIENGVNNLDDFLKIYNIDHDQYLNEIKYIKNNFTKILHNETKKKIITIIGNRDLLMETFMNDTKDININKIIVDGGYHCCYETIISTSLLIKNLSH